MSPIDLALFVLTMSLATVVTRAAPFLVPERIAKSPLIEKANKILPTAILTLLIMYSVKDTSTMTWPFALPEGVSIAATALVHMRFRNALLSIAIGTAIYMIFKQVVPGI